MICSGHTPAWGSNINKDVIPFLQFFLGKGVPINRPSLMNVVRMLHLAFKGMSVAEIYDVLMEQMLRAIHKYDPAYTAKVKSVCEVIDNVALRKQIQFNAADVTYYLEFDSTRYLRLLRRRGFLVAAPVKDKDKSGARFLRSDSAWPPPREFFERGAIGLAYYLQTDAFQDQIQTLLGGTRITAQSQADTGHGRFPDKARSAQVWGSLRTKSKRQRPQQGVTIGSPASV